MDEQRWQKRYFASLKQLQDLQTARREREAEEMQRAVALLKYHKKRTSPSNPKILASPPNTRSK